MDPLVIVFGLGVGILIGLTGIGGGSLMTPLLILFAGVQPVVAIGTDLAYGAITKTLGGWRHVRSGHVDLGLSKWLAFGSVPGSIAGVLAVDALHSHYGKGFDATLLTLRRRRAADRRGQRARAHDPLRESRASATPRC